MIDYRLKENRRRYFSQLYKLNLALKVHPGLVYLYMPKLQSHFNWTDEETLWFAAINGHTQNPITSLRIFKFMPAIPQSIKEWVSFQAWFDKEWPLLSFDTDRNKQKKHTIKGLYSYAELVKAAGSQTKLLSIDKSYKDLWKVAENIYSFGRLSCFSYLEYVYLNGYGADCETLVFNDLNGSRSHRNGMFFLLGLDDHVWDKRQPNSHDGNYTDFSILTNQLEEKAEVFLNEFKLDYKGHQHLNKFTLESCLCQFKNGFFSRRYPGVYADMGWDRIKWYDNRGMNELTNVFKDIRASWLPDWLREECEKTVTPRKIKASLFAETGVPFRAKYILGEI
jgi:hypothetical protein